MLRQLVRFLKEIYGFVLPLRCFGCNSKIGNGLICNRCLKEIERIKVKMCDNCGQKKQHCRCQNRVFYFEKTVAPFFNSGIARKGIYSLKFSNNQPVADFFANEMAKTVRDKYKDIHFDSICFVPSDRLRIAKRGYNQSELLAVKLSAALDIPLAENVLFKKTFAPVQHRSKGIEKRFKNADQSYYVKGSLKGKTVLLTDDIKTTGATLDICAKLLLAAGAEKVYCVTAVVTA